VVEEMDRLERWPEPIVVVVVVVVVVMDES